MKMKGIFTSNFKRAIVATMLLFYLAFALLANRQVDAQDPGVPDITPVITSISNIMTGVTEFNVTVRVVELNGVDTSGPITLRIPKDPRWTLSEPYDPGLTELGPISLNNGDWSFSENETEYILTTSTVIPANGDSTLGIEAIWDAGLAQGTYAISTQIDGGSGGEDRIENNSDAEKLDYFAN